MNTRLDDSDAIERARLASRRFVTEWQDREGAWHPLGSADDVFDAISLAVPYAEFPFRIIDGRDGRLLPMTTRTLQT
jgi:hypothetical protein